MSNDKHADLVRNTRIVCYVDILTACEYEQTVKVDPVYQHIGAVVKARRKKLELTQEDLAGQLGISRGSLANIETGRQNILVHQLYRIAASLGLAPTDLLPAPASERAAMSRTDLPLPGDLKPKQRDQIAQLLESVETGQAPSKERARGRSK